MPRYFCVEKGEEHGEFVITYYEDSYGRDRGTKQIKCLKCNRILLKNGKLVNQHPQRYRTVKTISLTKEGEAFLRQIRIEKIESIYFENKKEKQIEMNLKNGMSLLFK